MASILFKDTTYSVSGLIDDIGRGEVALPDIQRPFVWPASKVRDLLDSMYKGFPVGYLLFWETGAEAGTRQIGTGTKEKAPRLLIVDGQQRLTSLYAVVTGEKILRSDYTQARIRIAFRPADATFAVTDAAIEKDPEFLPDVSALWVPQQRRKVVRAFIERLQAKRALSQGEQDELEEALDGVFDLHGLPVQGGRTGGVCRRGAGGGGVRSHQLRGRHPQPSRLHSHSHERVLGEGPPGARGVRAWQQDPDPLDRFTLQLVHRALPGTDAARLRRSRLPTSRAEARVHPAARQGRRHRSAGPRQARQAVHRLAEGPGEGPGSHQLARVPPMP